MDINNRIENTQQGEEVPKRISHLGNFLSRFDYIQISNSEAP